MAFWLLAFFQGRRVHGSGAIQEEDLEESKHEEFKQEADMGGHDAHGSCFRKAVGTSAQAGRTFDDGKALKVQLSDQFGDSGKVRSGKIQAHD